MSRRLLAVGFLLAFAQASPDEHTEACTKALQECENDLECQNRLAPLMSACTTGTCQMQCRSAVLNVYQNKLGRALLRSDATCIPGREELRTCNFLPAEPTVHCSLAKLACEADLQCNAKWGVFISECESEASKGECSEKCRGLLRQTTATSFGSPFSNCTCTERDDELCQSLRDNMLGACLKESSGSVPAPGDNSVTESPIDDQEPSKSALQTFPLLLLCTLFVIRLFFV
ncbi:unnamed protein product [Caenorhabditis auriculariae]|uniref:GDNF/GAS1 domain-containing protein n=1 Tax=Caenorhabditis auriculariae TaxID=2777116 RepID=A0A8S1H492_9PELO|nr:unnamed protein product [Caenorhabditis auriculariae]